MFKMERDEESYSAGEILFYHDTGEVDRVEVLANNSDDDWVRYRLKVLEVVQKSRITIPSEAGEKFDCEKSQRVSVGGLWCLTED